MCSTDCSTPVECLTGALSALAGSDPKAAFGPGVLERTGVLMVARNRLDAELARTVRAGELSQASEHDGKATMASWLRGHHRLPQRSASALVAMGRALEHLPVLAAAAAAGGVPSEAVKVIAPIASDVNRARAEAQGVDLGAVEAMLTEVAITRPHDDLRQVVGHYLDRLDPDGPEPDPTAQRSLVFTKHADGSVTFHGHLDAVGGEKFQAAIESIQQASRPKGDLRNRAQQAGDALVQLCDNLLASGGLPTMRTVKPHLFLRIDLNDLLDPDNPEAGTGRTGFGRVISAARARWLACDGGISRVVFGPDGHSLDLGREHRVVTPGLRKAVELRDEHCVFAGCDAPAYWCDVHHLTHWIDGGETTLENSGLLCERHHTKVHHGFEIVRDDAGRWHTYRPDGTEILTYEPFLIEA